MARQLRTAEFDLPTGYVDPEGVVHKRVVVSELTGVDEELITDKKIANNGGKIITALLENKIVSIGDIKKPSSFIIKKMFTGDRDMCLLEIRKLSLGNDMELNTTCANRQCREKSIINLELDTVVVKTWDPENNPHHQGEVGYLDFTLIDGIEDKDGNLHKEGRFFLSTGEVEERMVDVLRTNPGKANTALFTAGIKQLGSLKMVDAKMIREMTRRDREYLSNLVKANQPGPQFLVDTICPLCIEEYKVPIELPYFFTSTTNN